MTPESLRKAEHDQARIQEKIDRLDAAIARAEQEKHKGTGPGRRQNQDRIDHLRYERNQYSKELSKLETGGS